MDSSITSLLSVIVTGILTPVIVGWFSTRHEVQLKTALAQIEQGQKDADARREEDRAETATKRSKEQEWRDDVDKKLAELAKKVGDVDKKVNRQVALQAADTRADIIHKCHRYLDDLGCASVEEKNALKNEHEQYKQFCDDLDIDNDFIDALVQKVMDLPGREI